MPQAGWAVPLHRRGPAPRRRVGAGAGVSTSPFASATGQAPRVATPAAATPAAPRPTTPSFTVGAPAAPRPATASPFTTGGAGTGGPRPAAPGAFGTASNVGARQTTSPVSSMSLFGGVSNAPRPITPAATRPTTPVATRPVTPTAPRPPAYTPSVIQNRGQASYTYDPFGAPPPATAPPATAGPALTQRGSTAPGAAGLTAGPAAAQRATAPGGVQGLISNATSAIQRAFAPGQNQLRVDPGWALPEDLQPIGPMAGENPQAGNNGTDRGWTGWERENLDPRTGRPSWENPDPRLADESYTPGAQVNFSPEQSARMREQMLAARQVGGTDQNSWQWANPQPGNDQQRLQLDRANLNQQAMLHSRLPDNMTPDQIQAELRQRQQANDQRALSGQGTLDEQWAARNRNMYAQISQQARQIQATQGDAAAQAYLNQQQAAEQVQRQRWQNEEDQRRRMDAAARVGGTTNADQRQRLDIDRAQMTNMMSREPFFPGAQTGPAGASRGGDIVPPMTGENPFAPPTGGPGPTGPIQEPGGVSYQPGNTMRPVQPGWNAGTPVGSMTPPAPAQAQRPPPRPPPPPPPPPVGTPQNAPWFYQPQSFSVQANVGPQNYGAPQAGVEDYSPGAVSARLAAQNPQPAAAPASSGANDYWSYMNGIGGGQPAPTPATSAFANRTGRGQAVGYGQDSPWDDTELMKAINATGAAIRDYQSPGPLPEQKGPGISTSPGAYGGTWDQTDYNNSVNQTGSYLNQAYMKNGAYMPSGFDTPERNVSWGRGYDYRGAFPGYGQAVGSGQAGGGPGWGWSPPGQQAATDEWQYELGGGWVPPGQQAMRDRTQVTMGPNFNPRQRDAGFQLMVSPPGQAAPRHASSWTPSLQQWDPPGIQAPPEHLNLSLVGGGA